jgi:hypothetical protein
MFLCFEFRVSSWEFRVESFWFWVSVLCAVVDAAHEGIRVVFTAYVHGPPAVEVPEWSGQAVGEGTSACFAGVVDL